jgi:hypothetical protein
MVSEPATPWRLFLPNTGLPSRSALVAPPLRLAALRWRVAFVVLVDSRPPPGVSTACLVAVAHFSGTRFPRVPPLRMCPPMLEEEAAHSQGPHARRDAPPRSPDRACGSRAPLKEIRSALARMATGGCPAPVPRAPGVRRRRHARRCAISRTQRIPRFSGPAVHEKGRTGDGLPSGPVAAVPGDRRSRFGHRSVDPLSAAPGIRHARPGEPHSVAALLETPEGGRNHSSAVTNPGRRREASWSEGEAERDRGRCLGEPCSAPPPVPGRFPPIPYSVVAASVAMRSMAREMGMRVTPARSSTQP